MYEGSNPSHLTIEITMKVFLDVECYPNYFLICFKSSNKSRYYQITDSSTLNIKEITHIMNVYETVGFNSKNYDLPMISYALNGASREELKRFSDQIITSGKFSWEVCRDFNIRIPYTWNHIDIIDVPKGVRVGLKMYGARMHTKILQDLPLEPDTIIKDAEHEVIRNYCFNDIDITIELYNKLELDLELRDKIGKIYNLELRSKSEPQISEAIIKKLLSTKSSYNTFLNMEVVLKYNPMESIKFQTSNLVEMFETLCQLEFRCNEEGKIIKTKEASNKVLINGATFSVGIGGLHSTEKHIYHVAKEDEFIIDIDAASYYPSIILNNKYYPERLGNDFLTYYSNFYKERIKAKENKDILKSETYKIILNGVFGKFGSKYSILYSPSLLLNTTLNGQLSLLMLIEDLSLQGFEIVSANTDGITIKGKRENLNRFNSILHDWEILNKFKLDRNYYKAIYHESVNVYIAIYEDGKIKGKGQYADQSLNKNPVCITCVEAVIEFLANGTNIEDTIFKNKDDIRKFLIIRRVEGGATFRDQYLGKTVRWYYSKNGDKITYKKNGNKVAGSDGAIPLMILNDEKRTDIDFQKYIDKSYEMLKNLGVK